MAGNSVSSVILLIVFIFLHLHPISCAVWRHKVNYPTFANHQRIYPNIKNNIPTTTSSKESQDGATLDKVDPTVFPTDKPEPKLKLQFVDDDKDKHKQERDERNVLSKAAQKEPTKPTEGEVDLAFKAANAVSRVQRIQFPNSKCDTGCVYEEWKDRCTCTKNQKASKLADY